jgi:probable rRNA maturation factor
VSEVTDISQSNCVDVAYENIVEEPWMREINIFCIRVLEKLKIHHCHLSVLICNDDVIRDLNKRYRSIDKPTDVLAFGQIFDGEPVPYSRNKVQMRCLGDIVVSIDTCKKNAALFMLPYEEEMNRLLIHGILHLIGMKHNGKNSEMMKKQEKLLHYFNDKKL